MAMDQSCSVSDHTVESGVTTVGEDPVPARLGAPQFFGARARCRRRRRARSTRDAPSLPRVIDGRVVRHEVEQQREATLGEPAAEPGERLVAAEVRVHVVADDGERRAADVLGAQIRKRVQARRANPCIRARPGEPDRPGLPHPEQPHPAETVRSDVVEECIGDVERRRPSASAEPDFVQEDARVDLVDRRMSHGSSDGAFAHPRGGAVGDTPSSGEGEHACESHVAKGY